MGDVCGVKQAAGDDRAAIKKYNPPIYAQKHTK